MKRRSGKTDASVHAAMIAASYAKALEYRQLPITRFHVLVGIFRVFMESFTEFRDSNEHTVTSSAASAFTDEGRSAISRFRRSRRPSSVGGESSEPGTVGPGERAKRILSMRLGRQRTSSVVNLRRQQSSRKVNLPTAPWDYKSAAVTRKQAIPTLRVLLNIIEQYGEAYVPCKPYAVFCDAVYQRVRAGRVTARVKTVLEKCAELADKQGMRHLKYTALLELGVARREREVLRQLEDKFRAIHALFDAHRARAEAEAIRNGVSLST